MKIDVLLGLQWGDEGKGKIVDVLTPNYDVIARFQGGPNAGHSLEFNNIKHVLHSIPSGVFREGVVNVIGNGVVIDPAVFKKEISELKKLGVDISNRLLVSKKAHLILPTHKLLDAVSENKKGKTKIGSTLKGIGPTYTDKIARTGLRVGDIIAEDFLDRYNARKENHLDIAGEFARDFELDEEQWFEGVNCLKDFSIVDSEYLINDYLNAGKRILAEGAQGTLLDIDFGTYPYVTSSNTVCAGACTGLGISPQKIGEVYGIFKAYCTRVGSGPFTTELEDKTGEKLRACGHEFGATTGRPRRCGWLDLVALKYSVMLNGVTRLIMTKADVLDSFEKIKVATSYKVSGSESKDFPFELDKSVEPVYTEFDGWNTDISDCKKKEDFPIELINYIKFIENELKVPISIVSTGADREKTIFID